MNPFLASILEELETASAALTESAVMTAVQKIEEHRRIFLYGAGRSGLMLRAFAMRLVQMGKCAYVAGETITPAIGPGDLLVVASASGKTHSVCHCAKTAKEAGAEVFVITASEHSPLTQIQTADVIFCAPAKDSTASGQVMGSLFEQLLLLFSDAVIAATHTDEQLMRQNHANLE